MEENIDTYMPLYPSAEAQPVTLAHHMALILNVLQRQTASRHPKRMNYCPWLRALAEPPTRWTALTR